MKKVLFLIIVSVILISAQVYAGCGTCDVHEEGDGHDHSQIAEEKTPDDCGGCGAHGDVETKKVVDLGDRYQTITKGKAIDYKKFLKKGQINIVDFYAEWCGPCQRLMPFLHKLAEEHEDLRVIKLDIVDWNSEVSKQYSIQSVPNLLLYDKELNQIGNNTQETIMKLMEIYNLKEEK